MNQTDKTITDDWPERPQESTNPLDEIKQLRAGQLRHCAIKQKVEMEALLSQAEDQQNAEKND